MSLVKHKEFTVKESMFSGKLLARGSIVMLGMVASWVPTCAAQYPNRPLRLLVTLPPGGSGDFQARILSVRLTEQLGQQLVVDNRPGAGGIVATELVAKSQPDGYTLLLGNVGALAIMPALQVKLPFDPVKDFAPISMTGRTTLVLAAGASLPVNSIKELIALAKANPGKLSYGSTGTGNVAHLAGEMFNSLAGVKLVHIPYKGAAPQLIDVMSGTVAVGFISITAAMPHLSSGRLKLLVIAGKERISAAPDVPTVAEVGMADIEIASGWFGVLAPARTPQAIVSRLNTEIVKVIEAPDVRERFLSQGLTPVTSTPQEFAELIKSERPKWSKAANAAGLRMQ
jgi:tripartite-type tricarboxylate transporter receptor subunit TctC